MDLGRVFAQGFVRKLGYVVATLLVAGAMSFCGAARANPLSSQCPQAPYPQQPLCSQGEAYQEVNRLAAAWMAERPDFKEPSYNCSVEFSGVCRASCVIRNGQWNDGAVTGCGDAFYSVDKTCLAVNNEYPPSDTRDFQQTPAMTCAGGCKITGTFGSTTAGGVSVVTMSDRSYTGEMCVRSPPNPNVPVPSPEPETAEEEKTKAPECTALGSGQTGCVKPNGDYCATASTGKTFCWTPVETGAKVDAPNAQTKTPIDTPVKPPSALITETTEPQRTEGHQAQICKNGTCTTYNVTNFVSVPTGTAHNSTGNNSGDGTGNSSGNGTGSGTGKPGEEGEGDSATDSGNCEAAPACTGDTLKCLHLKFTWKIQCHTKGDKITNGNACGSEDVPVCAGSSCQAAAYSQLLQAWRARCDAQADRDKLAGDAASGAADASGDDEAGTVGGLWAGDGVTPSFNLGKVSVGGGQLFPDVPLGAGTWVAPPELYSALDKIKVLVIAAFMIWGFFVLWKN